VAQQLRPADFEWPGYPRNGVIDNGAAGRDYCIVMMNIPALTMITVHVDVYLQFMSVRTKYSLTINSCNRASTRIQGAKNASGLKLKGSGDSYQSNRQTSGPSRFSVDDLLSCESPSRPLIIGIVNLKVQSSQRAGHARLNSTSSTTSCARSSIPVHFTFWVFHILITATWPFCDSRRAH
jgi:hypothetical protein